MKRDALAVIIGSLLALSCVIAIAPNAIENFRFHLGFYDGEGVEEELVSTVKKFDRLYVGFFTSGGDLSRLPEFPAAPLVKRRIVQEINSWSGRGDIFSHDRHMFEINDVDLFRLDMGYVETAESWRYLMRDRATGHRAEGEKSAYIRVRYILRKQGAQWRVEDFEVYGAGDEIPPVASGWTGY